MMKSCLDPPGPPPPPVERSAALLHKIYRLMIIVVAVHFAFFLAFAVIFIVGMRTINYYQYYLDGPMSGPNVAHTVTNAFGIVADVRNITSTAAAATNVMSSSVGLEVSPSSRHLLAASDDAIKFAVASLLNATAQKVNQFNASAPSDFLTWVVATDWRGLLEPKVVDMLAIARYGTASIGTILGALGSPVDVTLVPAQQLPKRSEATWKIRAK